MANLNSSYANLKNKNHAIPLFLLNARITPLPVPLVWSKKSLRFSAAKRPEISFRNV
jgi:hypothetical protein